MFDVKESESLPGHTMDDLAYEQMDQFHQYPIDPGHRHLVTSVDEHGRDVQFSNNEWYYKAGIMKPRRNQQEKKKELGITDIESALPSRKTADPYHFADRCEVNEDYTSKVCCLRHQQINECIKVVDGFSGLRVSLWGVLPKLSPNLEERQERLYQHCLSCSS
jgi:hypothetical protein